MVDLLLDVCYYKYTTYERIVIEMKDVIYFNDTGWDVKIHPGTDEKVEFKDTKVIKNQEMIKFSYPEEYTPMLKMWDYGDSGLHLIVMLMDDDFLEDNF